MHLVTLLVPVLAALPPDTHLVAFSEMDPLASRPLALVGDARPWEVIEIRAPGKGTRRLRAIAMDAGAMTLDPQIALTGRVRSDEDAPVAGASVRLYPELIPEAPLSTARTDTLGTYSVAGLSPGLYRVEVDAPGFAQARSSLLLAGPGASSLDVRLESGWSASVVVRDAAGQPVPDARVLAIGKGSAVVRRTSTDGAGRASLQGLEHGATYTVLVRPKDLWPEIAMVREEAASAEITCRKGHDLVISVAGEDARIRLLGSDDLEYVAHLAQGESRHLRNAPDRSELRADAPGHPAVVQSLRSVVQAAVVVPEGIPLRGFVRDARGPLGGAEIRLSGRSGPPDAISAGDGSFTVMVADARAASGLVDVAARGHRGVESVSPSTSPPASLRDKGSIVLLVKDRATGKPLSAFRLAVTEAGRSDPTDRDLLPFTEAEARSGAGVVTIDDLPEGRYVLRVMSASHRPWESPELTVNGDIKVDVVLESGLALGGQVVEKGTDRPIAGARIWGRALEGIDSLALLHPEAFSDASGSFVLDGLDRLPSAVTALHARYASATAAVPAGATKVRVELGRGGSILAQVPGRAGVVVRASSLGSALRREATTDELGVALLAPLRSGTYQVSTRRPHSMDFRTAIVLEGRETRVRLGGVVRVWGRVTSRGQSVTAASVSFEDRKGVGKSQVEVDASGAYEIDLDPGSMLARVSVSGTTPYEVTLLVEIPDRRDAHLDLVLPTATIEGTVLDADTRDPIQDARAVVTRSSPPPKELSAVSDRSGHFAFEDLEDGTYELVVRAAGHGYHRSTDLRVTDGASPSPLEILLGAGGSLRATMTRGNGSPILEAILSILDGAGNTLPMEAQNVANAGGQLLIDGISPGTYTLLATAPGLAPTVLPGVEVRAGETTAVALSMTPGASLAARGGPGWNRVTLIPAQGSPLSFLPAPLRAFMLSADLPDVSGHLFAHLPPSGYDVLFQGTSGSIQKPVALMEGASQVVSP